MLTSMTGFSRVSLDREWGTLTLEIFSVNSRYLEVFVKTGRDLMSEEPFIHSALKKRLNRGKVQVRVDLSWSPDYRAGRINSEVLSSYAGQIKAIGEGMGRPNDVPLESLLGLPGVTEPPSLSPSIRDEIGESLRSLVDSGIDSLISMRQKEGAELEMDLKGHLELYESLVDRISSSWKDGADRAFLALKDRVDAVAEKFDCSLDEGRLAQEMTFIADKWDISEEISRTQSHLGQFKSVMADDGPVGRKLDFLLQEMNRELNTMGSKVSDSDIRWSVVEGKTVLERIREQVQNVE
ncbi:MAG: YicC family protein [Dethiosulfovibrio sp.]|nr:YicC family protein [Dethiosulfovibrio sp.]